jgi:RHS repeat-associated protein
VNRVNNRLTEAGMVYDAAGNLIENGPWKYRYDAENRLIQAMNGSQTVAEMRYDGSGQRIKKAATVDSQTTITRFIYNGMGKLIAEHDGVAAMVTQPTREYVYGPSGLLMVVEGGATQYLTPDHLGSPRLITDASGQVVSRRDFYPFGEEIQAGTGGRTAGIGYGIQDQVRQHFTGYERDTETGLDFAQARYYANTMGRFMSVDPVAWTVERFADPQRINLYTYCRNNPLSFIDPTGETIDFANKDAQKKFAEYEEFLKKDPKKYANHLATIQQLKDSDVRYVVALAGSGKLSGGTEGEVTSDGKSVFLNIGNVGGTQGEQYSLFSRFAHELEHGRQFNNGEYAVAFDKNGNPTGFVALGIGDEIKAFQAQLTASAGLDFNVKGGMRGPEFAIHVLLEFSKAKTDPERAAVLAQISPTYKSEYERFKAGDPLNKNFTLSGVSPGTLIRPSDRTFNNGTVRLFGRTNKP